MGSKSLLFCNGFFFERALEPFTSLARALAFKQIKLNYHRIQHCCDHFLSSDITHRLTPTKENFLFSPKSHFNSMEFMCLKLERNQQKIVKAHVINENYINYFPLFTFAHAFPERAHSSCHKQNNKCSFFSAESYAGFEFGEHEKNCETRATSMMKMI